MNFLGTILRRKREEVELRRREIPPDLLRRSPLYTRDPLPLCSALSKKPLAVIAEIKKASPSKGVIRKDFDPVRLAELCVEGGASALSVLTDREFFQGDISYLHDIRSVVTIPLLRKDFIIDEYQIHEAKAAGADAVLFILAALDRAQFVHLRRCALELGLETLVEVHRPEELDGIGEEHLGLVGINNRDLTTFETDLSVTYRVQSVLPPGALVVSESGIGSPGELLELARHGIHAALIGESLMRADNPGEKLRALLAPFREGLWSV